MFVNIVVLVYAYKTKAQTFVGCFDELITLYPYVCARRFARMVMRLRESRRLSNLLQDVLGVNAQEADSREFLTQVLERVTAMINLIVHNQPAVV